MLGTDGKLYAIGQHPTKAATAVEIDPETLAATPTGRSVRATRPTRAGATPAEPTTASSTSPAAKIPWYLVAYDRQTGTSRHTLAETETVGGMVSVGQQHDGCTGQVQPGRRHRRRPRDTGFTKARRFPRPAGDSRLRPGRAQSAPPAVAAAARSQHRAWAVPDAEGFAEIWVRTAEAKVARRRRAAKAARGYSHARIRTRSARLEAVPLSRADLSPLHLPPAASCPTAACWAPPGVRGQFRLRSRRPARPSTWARCHLSHYATALLDGKVYMSGYPTSPLYVFDPAKPWTAGTVVRRPRDPGHRSRRPIRASLLLLGEKELAGTHKMYAAATGADGKVYFGGQWIRDGACGGLAWYDPSTGKAGGLWQPLSNYQVTHLAAADGGTDHRRLHAPRRRPRA